jgi:hypothetical protein
MGVVASGHALDGHFSEIQCQRATHVDDGATVNGLGLDDPFHPLVGGVVGEAVGGVVERGEPAKNGIPQQGELVAIER